MKLFYGPDLSLFTVAKPLNKVYSPSFLRVTKDAWLQPCILAKSCLRLLSNMAREPWSGQLVIMVVTEDVNGRLLSGGEKDGRQSLERGVPISR